MGLQSPSCICFLSLGSSKSTQLGVLQVTQSVNLGYPGPLRCPKVQFVHHYTNFGVLPYFELRQE